MTRWIPVMVVSFILHSVFALHPVPKLDFGDDFYESASRIKNDTYEEQQQLQYVPRQESESDAIKKRSEQSDKYPGSEIVCTTKKCLFTFDDDEEIDDIKQKKNDKVTTDVRVRVLTKGAAEEFQNNEEEKSNEDDDEDDDNEVPIIKGFKGVKEDSNSDYKSNPQEVEVPSIVLQPPRDDRRNWYDYLEAKSKGNNNNNNNRGSSVPPGWSPTWSPGWKPIPKPRYPDDYYHYNVHGREGGFVNSNPHFVTYCRCSRKPMRPTTTYRPYHPYHSPTHSWYMTAETTTKNSLDGKLAKPFNKKT